MTLFCIIYITFVVTFFLLLKFSSEPYPKEWEEKENEELKRKFKEYEENTKGQNK